MKSKTMLKLFLATFFVIVSVSIVGLIRDNNNNKENIEVVQNPVLNIEKHSDQPVESFERINDDGSFVLTDKTVVMKDFSNNKDKQKLQWYTDPYCPDCIRTHSKTASFLKENFDKIEIKFHPLNFLANKTITNYSLKASSWVSAIAEVQPEVVFSFMELLYNKDVRDELKIRTTNESFIDLAVKAGVTEKNIDYITTHLDAFQEAVNKGSNGLRTNVELTSKSPTGKFYVPFIFDETTQKVLLGEEEDTETHVIKPIIELIKKNPFKCSEDCEG